MLKAFEVYDKGGRGLLSREDFKRVLKHFTVDLTKSQIETLLQRLYFELIHGGSFLF